MNLVNNTKWVGIAQLVKILCQILSLIILARLIPPNEYGLMTMAGVIVALGFLFRDMGTSAALIQKKEINEDLKNAVFGLNVLTGIILAILISLFSPFVAEFFEEESLVPILLLLSLTFPITSIASSHLALMERDSDFKTVASIESISALISTFIAMFAAYNNFGVYSLVIQSLLNSTISTILIVKKSKWKPLIHTYKNLNQIKEIFNFSGNLIAFNFINYFSRNTDRYIIGKFMTSTILGAYDIAYKIMLLPLQTLTHVVGRSMFPILSKHQNNKIEFNETYITSIRWITFFSFPLMSGIMVLREPFVNIVFGEKWYLVTGILLWLAPTGMLQSINSTTGAILTAKGKTNILFYTGIMSALIYMVGFLVGSQYDIIIFSKYYFYANIIAVGLNLYIIFKIIELSLKVFIISIYPALLASLLMFIVLSFSLSIFNSNSIVDFIIMIFLGIGSYTLFSLIMPNSLIRNLIWKNRK